MTTDSMLWRSYARRGRMSLMNGDDKAKAAEADEAARREPGMGSALLAVLVMILSTAILALLIYLVMVTVVPGEPRQVRKAAEVEQPLYQAQGPRRLPN